MLIKISPQFHGSQLRPKAKSNMLKVEKLNVGYAGVAVLRDVSLTVNEGEIVSVVGANGGGKTTLLKTISGLLKPSSGAIEFMGEKIHELPPHEICKRRLIQVPEGRQLFPKMKVINNLEMGAYLSEARKNYDSIAGKGLQALPHLSGEDAAEGGLTERRRTADAGHRQGLDVNAETAHARRAFGRSLSTLHR